MNIKNFSLATLCILTLGLLVGLTGQVSLAQDQPEVYLNDSPAPIIGSKEKLGVPIFFITDVLVDKDLEFYYWREVHEDNSTEYLNSECNWVTFSDSVEIQPLILQAKLPSYLYVKWIDPPCKEQEPQKYTLHVCIDSNLDELYPDEFQEEMTYACAAQEVYLDYCIPENILLDGQVNPAKISDSVLEGVQPPSHVLTIRDDCDDTVCCQVTSIPYFVDQPAENAILDGEITVQFKNNQSIQTHKGNIVLGCPFGGESITKEIPVELKVTSSSGLCESKIFFHYGGFGLMVPDGGKIPLSVTAGEEELISLTCGQFEPLSDFEANVSGSGCFSVGKDISLGVHSKVKIIPISSTDCSDSLTVSSGTTSATATVILTFQGSPQTSVIISPASVTIPSNQTSAVVRVQDSSHNDLNYEVTRVDSSWISSPKVGYSATGGLTITINRSGLSSRATGYVHIKPEGFSEKTIKVTVEVASTTGSLLLAPSAISTTLPSGKSCTETIFVTCNGSPAGSFSVSGPNPAKTWLSVGSSRSNSFILTLTTNGLSEGDTDSADLEVSSSSCGSGTLTKILHVSLTVKGVCTPKTAELSRNPISVSVTKGSNAGQSVSIEDNCGNPLDFRIEAVSDDSWIESPKEGDEGTGTLSVNFDTTSPGTYDGNITISTTILGNLINLTLDINLTVSSGGGSGVSAITLIEGDTYRYFDFKAGEVKLFKFRADSGPSNPTLSVVTEVQSHYGNQKGNLHMMAKYAGQDWENGPPIDSDYADIKIFVDGDWTKLQGVYNGIYYFMTRTLVKRIYINYSEQISNGCWYLWVKNIGGFRLDDCMVHFRTR